MVAVKQLVLSLLGTQIQKHGSPLPPNEVKSIAVIGGGSAGLAMLKTWLDVPQEIRASWDIVLYEKRNNLGGIWLPDPVPEPFPIIPGTPLYPFLRTNTPVPSMTYPAFPFPPQTPLFPSHEHIESYHLRYASAYNLSNNVRLNHDVLTAAWTGHRWNLTIRDETGAVRSAAADHVVVATGNNQYPHQPHWPGEAEWLSSRTPDSGFQHEIIHSMWYRGPQRYNNRTVLVIGTGSSGRDISAQIAPVARRLFISSRHLADETIDWLPDGAEAVPDVSRMTSQNVVLINGTYITVDSILLATGYEIRKPFLEDSGVLSIQPSANGSAPGATGLVTNLHYIFPLHEHIFSLSPEYPTTALAFVGLPSAIANCPSDIAQSLYVTHAILDRALLPSREELLKKLHAYERRLREKGYDPYVLGHQLPPNTSSDYQDALVAYLKDRGALPNDGKKFVEKWRRDVQGYEYLKKGWKRIEGLGTADDWLKGVETEEQWAGLMERVNAWQAQWEIGRGI